MNTPTPPRRRFRARTLGFATEFAVWYARLQALQGGATPMADEELAALYSMALLRLVNGLGPSSGRKPTALFLP